MSIKSAVANIFSGTPGRKKLTSERAQKYALGVTILFVDLASVDNDFDYDEQEFIETKLLEMFKITKDEIYSLIKEAEKIVSSGENIDSYALELQEISTASERENIMKNIDSLIKADGHFDQYEIKLRERYEKLLAVRVRPS